MSGTRVRFRLRRRLRRDLAEAPLARRRAPVVLLALVACVCSASAALIGDAQAPARQPSVTMDVVYGHKDGLALTLDVHRAARPNGAGVISIVSGGWQSSVEMAQIFAQVYPPLNEKGFTVFAVRHGSRPRYPLSSIVADVRRSVRFIRQHAKEYGVDPNRIGAQFSPIRFVSPRAAPSLIVHGDADTAVPIDQGETMYAALTKAGVPASFIRIEGAEHGFEGAAPVDRERAFAAMLQWFEQHLGNGPK